MTSIAASVSAPANKKRSPWDILSDVEQTRRPQLATEAGKLALEKFKADEALHSTPSKKPPKPASRLLTKDPDNACTSSANLIKECEDLIESSKPADNAPSDWDDALESDYEEFNSAWNEAKSSREAQQ